MARRPRHGAPADSASRPAGASRQPVVKSLRIVGGLWRGRKIQYHGDPGTRPMKERVREAVFNLLGPAVREKAALDLFAGTGALGLEALSRGAASATFVERNIPTAKVLRSNIESLGCEDLCQVHTADALAWFERPLFAAPRPWLVFISPPYAFYETRWDEMLKLIDAAISHAPPDSLFVVESEVTFDAGKLPSPEQWDVRRYPPAQIAIRRKRSGAGAS